MKYRLIFRYIARMLASISMMKSTVALISARQNQNALATVSWNR